MSTEYIDIEQLCRLPPVVDLEGEYFQFVKGGLRFLDVATRTPVERGKRPASIDESELTSRGLENLVRLGRSGHKIHLVLGTHASIAHSREMQTQHRRLLSRTRVVGIEANWRRRTDNNQTLPKLGEISIPRDSRSQFQRHQIPWLRERHKTLLPCELSPDDSVGAAYQRTDRLYYEASANTDWDKRTRDVVRLIADMAGSILRHWGIPGMFGYWLEQAEAQDLLTPRQALPLEVGYWQLPIRWELENLGVPVTVHRTAHAIKTPPEEWAYGSTYMSMVYNGGATYEELARPVTW